MNPGWLGKHPTCCAIVLANKLIYKDVKGGVLEIAWR